MTERAQEQRTGNAAPRAFPGDQRGCVGRTGQHEGVVDIGRDRLAELDHALGYSLPRRHHLEPELIGVHTDVQAVGRAAEIQRAAIHIPGAEHEERGLVEIGHGVQRAKRALRTQLGLAPAAARQRGHCQADQQCRKSSHAEAP